MTCEGCGQAADEPGQRFCTRCGAALPTSPLPPPSLPPTQPVAAQQPETQLLTTLDDTTIDGTTLDDGADAWIDDDPVWAATGPLPQVAGSVATGDLPATQLIGPAPAPARPVTPYDFLRDEPTTEHTRARSITGTTTATIPMVAVGPARQRFTFGAVTLLGTAGGALTIVAMFTTVLGITSDTRLAIGGEVPSGFRTGTWLVDDLADNLSIAGLVAALAMVAGGVAAGFGWRWGAGLAGGGGLGFAGVAFLSLGLAQAPIDAARDYAAIPSDQEFTLTITRDAGYWLLLAAAAVGVVLFFASINDAVRDRRPGLNPWIAALGALATLVAAAGPLLPEHQAAISDNWMVDDAPGAPPALLLVARLVQLGLLAFTGLVGFLSVRRYGLGLAIGGALPIVWLGLSTLLDLTDDPVGPGYLNPGADVMNLHGVTVIGLSALAGIGVLAVIAAYDQGVRERG